jgi:hypothetical protein
LLAASIEKATENSLDSLSGYGIRLLVNFPFSVLACLIFITKRPEDEAHNVEFSPQRACQLRTKRCSLPGNGSTGDLVVVVQAMVVDHVNHKGYQFDLRRGPIGFLTILDCGDICS